MTFYVPGTTGIIWCFLFYLLIFSSPQQHPRISKAEQEYLCSDKNCYKESGEKLEVPWKKMFQSKAVHALWITHMSSAFGFYLLTINLSLFIREALGFRVINVCIIAITLISTRFNYIYRMVSYQCFLSWGCCCFLLLGKDLTG